MEKVKVDHPCQAGVTTFLACLMSMNGVGISDGVTAGKLQLKYMFVWKLPPWNAWSMTVLLWQYAECSFNKSKL